jgi:glutaconate CoA-transferase subunit B
MDFGGPDNAVRLVSLHPGVPIEEVRDNTGFDIVLPEGAIPSTPAPGPEALDIIRRLDPHNIRATLLKGDPPGIRAH